MSATKKRRPPTPTRLPKNVGKRDLEEFAVLFSGQAERCACGHLKRVGYVCWHCDREDGALWPWDDEQP